MSMSMRLHQGVKEERDVRMNEPEKKMDKQINEQRSKHTKG